MKRIYKILLFAILVAGVPFTLASGQEKKTENKVKVVIDDGSGPETVLDTTIISGEMPKIITLKNGKVIHLDKHGDDGEKMVWVSVTHDDDADHVFAYSDAKHNGENAERHVIITSKDSKEGEKKIEKKIIIKDGDANIGEGGDKFDVFIETDSDADTEATEYVIAKDGMVVTIKGSDETKVQELAREIENKLGVMNNNEGGKPAIKEKSVKSGKK